MARPNECGRDTQKCVLAGYDVAFECRLSAAAAAKAVRLLPAPPAFIRGADARAGKRHVGFASLPRRFLPFRFRPHPGLFRSLRVRSKADAIFVRSKREKAKTRYDFIFSLLADLPAPLRAGSQDVHYRVDLTT